MPSDQDFCVQSAWIMDLWQQRKLEDAAAMELLVKSRSRGLTAAIATIEAAASRQKMFGLKDSIAEVTHNLYEGLQNFRQHPLIDEWMTQFTPENYMKKTRFKPLLLTACSQAGKSWKAMSLFGVAETLKVNCAGLALGTLPSIAHFDRSRHKCILWDEIRADQVIGNKEVFQSGAFPVSMSQSQCNAFSYEVWLYQTAFVMCSNFFPMSVADDRLEKTTPEQLEWLQGNIVHVPLPAGERWY